MLRGIHKASSTWLGKGVMAVVMGFLVISFAIWGIGDIFRGFARDAAITVGGTKITVEQLRQYYTDQLQPDRPPRRPPDHARPGARARHRPPADRPAGRRKPRSTSRPRRSASASATPRSPAASPTDPNFRGLTGQFDRARFEQLIREAGFTESRYVEEQRRVMLRRQWRRASVGEVHVPAIAVAAINRYQNEQRSIDYVALGPAQAGDIPAPTPDVLDKYFEERKVLFRAPEYRKVTLLSLSPSDIAKPDAVSDADAKNYYEQHKAQYGTPEQRELRQIVYPERRKRRTPRTNASPRARASTTWPRSAA